jgi:glutaconate CoA-transferase subunit B
VISSLGVFGFDPASREMVLESLHPGVTLEEVKSQTGWPVRVTPALGETPEPTREELDVLRRFDPDGMWTG